MVNIEKINKIKRNELIELLSNPEVNKYFDSVKIFGSTITDKCTESSDIDMLVSLKDEYKNEKGINDSYLALTLGSNSDKDIFYAHEQKGNFNKKLYENMINGVEILK